MKSSRQVLLIVSSRCSPTSIGRAASSFHILFPLMEDASAFGGSHTHSSFTFDEEAAKEKPVTKVVNFLKNMLK